MFCLLVNNLNGVVTVGHYEQPDVSYEFFFDNAFSILFIYLIVL